MSVVLGSAGLSEMQSGRLRRTVRHAYENVSFYRRKFEEIGLHPSDISGVQDIEYLPITTKEDLRRNFPYGLCAVDVSELRRIHASSGTTGKSTLVAYTDSDLKNWSELVARSLSHAGVMPGWKVHNAFGYGLFTGGLGLHSGIERLGCAVIPASAGQSSRQASLIADLRPEAIVCTPSYLMALGDALELQGLDPRDSSLRVAVCGAEPWTGAMRSRIEERFEVRALDIYGLSEVMGPGVAMEAADSPGLLTIWEDRFFPEIVNGDLESVGQGVPGELLLTTLTNQAMPLIRYRTRDRTVLHRGLDDSPFRRLGRVEGRTDDMVTIRGVNFWPSQLEPFVLGGVRLNSVFQVVLSRTKWLDVAELVVEALPGVSDYSQIETDLERSIRNNLGLTFGVRVRPPGALPRSEGKAVKVIDNRE